LHDGRVLRRNRDCGCMGNKTTQAATTSRRATRTASTNVSHPSKRIRDPQVGLTPFRPCPNVAVFAIGGLAEAPHPIKCAIKVRSIAKLCNQTGIRVDGTKFPRPRIQRRTRATCGTSTCSDAYHQAADDGPSQRCAHPSVSCGEIHRHDPKLINERVIPPLTQLYHLPATIFIST
jgi:hypothetical protein